MSATVTASSHAVATSTAASTRDATERYLDLLRDHQQRYLEAAGAAAAEVRGIGQLESLAASTLQLSRQFFDAQRGIVGRVGRHQADLLEHRAGDDLLDLSAWDAGAATRQLAALLDGWWAALNSNAGRTIDEAAARRALVRQVDRIEQSCATASSPEASPAHLPAAIRSVLDHAEGADLRSLLRHLGAVLQAPAADAGAAAPQPILVPSAPEPLSAFPPPSSPMHRGAGPAHSLDDSGTAAGRRVVAPTTRDLRILDVAPESIASASIADEHLTRLERLEQDRRRFWSEDDAAGRDGGSWFPTPAVVSIATATAALTAALALIG